MKYSLMMLILALPLCLLGQNAIPQTSLQPEVGSLAPDFTQPDQHGKEVKLSHFKGNYVLLDFWASWCGPCREENPNVKKQYARYKDKNFIVLSVSADSKKEAWLKAITEDRLQDFIQVSDLSGPVKNAVLKTYGVAGIPDNFLIDPDGNIIAKNLRGIDLAIQLKKLFEK